MPLHPVRFALGWIGPLESAARGLAQVAAQRRPGFCFGVRLSANSFGCHSTPLTPFLSWESRLWVPCPQVSVGMPIARKTCPLKAVRPSGNSSFGLPAVPSLTRRVNGRGTPTRSVSEGC